MTKELEEFLPDEDDDTPFLDPTARVVGDVDIGGNAALFPGCMVEGDEDEVDIGDESIIMNKASIQATEDHPVSLKERSFISHGARLEGCEIGENSLVGLDAVVMEGAEVGKNAIVGTNAIVPEGMEVPDNKLVLGQPAEVVRDVSEEDLDKIDEIRETLTGKRDEFQMIEKRGERFDVFKTPKRPDELLDESEIDREEMKEIPDLEKVREELKDLEEDTHTF
ncbi:MAG: gamma carbonic anhydrase family protein [Candidatus Thermoplasmatota archaeon]|nr:gamma carbonic anhydrase family protein [Candidatus Thermoplasmatota archaeon]